ncbi:MAG TPA: hypothetical protein VME47_20015 [Acetobacteraceae bacterium]|nr:hypothetical protein [Acetobacteraceae bacterium]
MTAQSPDLLERIIGVPPNSPLSRLRALRPDIVRHTQGSHDVLLCPADPGGLPLQERALIAARVAEASGHVALTRHYRQLLAERGDPPQSRRLDAILQHADRVATAPRTAQPAHIEALRAVGLSARDIVALTQVVAFVSYQVRAAVGLALLAEGHAA